MSQEIPFTMPNNGINESVLISELKDAYPSVLGTLLGRPDSPYIIIEDGSTVTQSQLQAIVDSHDPTQQTELQRRDTLQRYTRDEVIVFFRQKLIEADGNGQAMANLYSNAVTYTQNNSALASTVKSLNTIEDTPLTGLLSLTLISQRKQFLRLFLQALSLWS